MLSMMFGIWQVHLRDDRRKYTKFTVRGAESVQSWRIRSYGLVSGVVS